MADVKIPPTVCDLPELPRKARPRLDQLGFREQGSKVADERIKKLRANVASLGESKEQLKKELDQLYRDAKKESDDLLKAQEEVERQSSKQVPDPRALHLQVVEQIKQTRTALSKLLPNTVREVSPKRAEESTLVTKSEKIKKKLEGLRRDLEKKKVELRVERDKRYRQDEEVILALEKEITGLRKTIGKHHDQLRDGEMKKSQDEHVREREHRIQLARKQTDDRRFYSEQKERSMALEELGQRVGAEKYGATEQRRRNSLSLPPSPPLFNRGYHRERNPDMADPRPYRIFPRRPPRRRRAPRPYVDHGKHSLLMDWPSSSSDTRSDWEVDSDSGSEDTAVTQGDARERRNLLKSLERLVSDAITLEDSHIQTVKETRDEIEDVEHLIDALESEIRLETLWLQKIASEKSSFVSRPSTDTTTGHLSDKHLSGRRMPGIYRELKKGQYRVLVVLPAPEPSYPLICKLETWGGPSTTTPPPKYAALSYFWGHEVHNGRIYLLSHDDESPSPLFPSEWGRAARQADRIPIRNNLFRALLRLRRCGLKATPIALWIDFMCINQEDTGEKTKQLSRMIDIYSNAANVCIWLGEGDNSGRSDEAMKFISTIMDFAIIDRHVHDKDQARKWFALGELMRDRWFSRRWVVQEIALARDATVHCGGSYVRWSDFADAASLLVSHQENIKSLFDLSDLREGRKTLGDVNTFGASILLDALNNLFRRKPNGDIKKPIKTIETLVTSLKTFDTGDRRDLIYSLVCIARDTSDGLWRSRPLKQGQPQFLVDYSYSEVDVYTRFTKFCVETSKSLDIICRPWAMPLLEKGTLPSWIPLLSSSEFGIPEEVYSGRKNGENLVGPAGTRHYEACSTDGFDGSFEPVKSICSKIERQDHVPEKSPPNGHDSFPGDGQSRISSEGDDGGATTDAQIEILHARGFTLATIESVSPRNTGGVILRESLEMGGWAGFNKDTDSVPDPIWRTLVADRDQHGRVPPSWYQRACLRCLEIADTFNNGDLNVGELLQGDSEMLRQYLERVRNVTWNRRFFTALFQKQHTNVTAESRDSVISLPLNMKIPHSEETFVQGTSQADASQVVKVGEDDETGGPVNVGGEDQAPPPIQDRGGENEVEEGKEEVQEETRVDGERERDRREGNENSENIDEDMIQLGIPINAEETKEEENEESLQQQETQDDNQEHQSVIEETLAMEREEVNPKNSEDDEDVSTDGSDGEVETEGEETKSERSYFGLCPPETKKGDLICILFGCSVPVILRRESGGYMKLLGEAYVHGVMDGEAMETFRDDKSSKEELFLIA